MSLFWRSNNTHPLVECAKKNGASIPGLENLLDNQTVLYQSKDTSRLLQSLASLPELSPSLLELDRDRVIIGRLSDLNSRVRENIEDHLKLLIPWRKGPFELFGRLIDAEWQSHLKWNRLYPHLGALKNHRILDVGASSGYYMFRLAEYHPRWILGIDPSLRFKIQFETLQKYARVNTLFYEPLGLSDLDQMTDCFDTIFCMGILYHQKSPIQALKILKNILRPGGQIFLETLIIPVVEKLVISPYPTYAKMKNTYFLPSPPSLEDWLEKTGFESYKLLSQCPTTVNEQRNTEFCPPPAQSLKDFLNPMDYGETYEGYHAPVRALYRIT